MDNSYNSNEPLDPKSEYLRSKLLKLKKHQAPEDFEDKLFQNIRRIDQGEKVNLLERKSNLNQWIVSSLSMAAGIAIAFVIFSAPAKSTIDPQQQFTKEQEMLNKKDSLKEVQKNFDQKLNLVNEKK